MDSRDDQSISSARVLVDALPWLIEQAEAGKLSVPAVMLRLAFEDAFQFVMQTERRCGRVASTADFPHQFRD